MWSSEERLKFAYTFIKYQQKDTLLDIWQDAYIRSKSRYIAIVKSRRVGWSFISAMKALIKAMDPDRIGFTQQFVSYNEEDALEKINYARQFYESIPSQCKKKIVTDNKSMLEFKDYNGKTTSRLISIPCRPPRGKGGCISLDEYAIYNPKMSKLVFDAALPVISRGGCIEMGSSPLGKIGMFYEVLTEPKFGEMYQRYNVPWWFCRELSTDVPKAIKEAPLMQTDQRVEKFGTDIMKSIFNGADFDTFTQEYECTFIDSEASYITIDLIYANTPGMREGDILLPESDKMDDMEYWQYNRDIDFQAYTDPDTAILNYKPNLHGETLYLGYDVGRTHDMTSIYIIGLMADGKKRSFARIELKNKTYEDQKNTILKLYKGLPIFRGCMDSTGMGKPVYESLQRILGDRIEGITFTPEIKEVMAINVKHELELKNYLLENNKNFHNQIHSIKRIATGGKYFRYDAARNELGHADSFWAWALATHAITEQKTGNFYSRYSQNKQNMIESKLPNNLQNKEISPINTTKKGKSLNRVLRGVINGK